MKIQKIDYLKKEKSFLDEIKGVFHNFLRVEIFSFHNFHLVKKNKKADTSFKYLLVHSQSTSILVAMNNLVKSVVLLKTI